MASTADPGDNMSVHMGPFNSGLDRSEASEVMMLPVSDEATENNFLQDLSQAAQRWRSTATSLMTRSFRALSYKTSEDSDRASLRAEQPKYLPDDESDETRETLSLLESKMQIVEPDLKFRLTGRIVRRVLSWVFRADGTMNRTLANIMELEVKASKTPVQGIYTEDVTIDPATNVWIRIFAHSETNAEEKLPLIVYFHGGGFAFGSPAMGLFDRLCRTLAKACHAVVISVNYRLTPEFVYPVQYEDCFGVLQWLQTSWAEVLPPTVDVSQCILAGDSAGGNIAHFMGCEAAEVELDPIKIRGLILFQPFFGGPGQTEAEVVVRNPILVTVPFQDWLWKAVLPKGADRNHKACNIFGPDSKDISGLQLPPIFVATGTHDILKNWQWDYIRRMRRLFGSKAITAKHYNGGFHGFYGVDPNLQKLLLADLNVFIRGVLRTEDDGVS